MIDPPQVPDPILQPEPDEIEAARSRHLAALLPSSRDPRTDPGSGDLVRFGSSTLLVLPALDLQDRRVVHVVAPGHVRTTEQAEMHFLRRAPTPRSWGLGRWRDDLAQAEVLAVASDPICLYTERGPVVRPGED